MQGPHFERASTGESVGIEIRSVQEPGYRLPEESLLFRRRISTIILTTDREEAACQIVMRKRNRMMM